MSEEQNLEAKCINTIRFLATDAIDKAIEALEANDGALAQSVIAGDRNIDDMERSIEQREEELKRRAERYDQLRMQLAAERKRIVNELIPMRYRMEGTAQLMPVAVEIVLPEASA